MRITFDIEGIEVPDGSGLVEYRAWFNEFASDKRETEWQAVAHLCEVISAYEVNEDKIVDPYER